MVKWQRWIRPGLAATFLLAVIAAVVGAPPVERDLQERVAARLAADGQGWAGVSISGRNVTISGTAPSTESQAIAVASAKRVAAVGNVSDRSDLLPIASPYIWTADKKEGAVTLSGSVPSESFRNSILAAARRALPEADIHDAMVLARGAPTGFSGGTAFALQRLAGLSDGMATLTDGVLSFAGLAADARSYRAGREALAGEIPPGIELGAIDILPARANPFVWSADYDGKSVTLAGYVPDELALQTLITTAREVMPGKTIVDKTQVASGAPAGFVDAAVYAMTALTRFSQGGVALDGLKLDVAGTAKSVDDYDAILGSFAAGLPKGVRIVSGALAPATVGDYGWKGERNEGSVTLTGFVPSQDQKAEVAGIAQSLFAGLRIDDRVRIAGGAPRMDWIGGVKFAMSQLARLGKGQVVLGDKTYAIEGEAISPDAYIQILEANRATLPASLALKSAAVTPPVASPYRFAASRQPGKIVIEGYASSEKERETLIDNARRAFGDAAVDDQLAYAGGAPDGYVGAATAAMQAVSRLASGHAEITDGKVLISGGAYTEAAESDILAGVRDTTPEGFTPESAIVVRQPDQPATPARCRELLQAALQAGRIEFEGDKSDIADQSQGILDRVAAILQRCPDTNVEIAAHTDSDGSTGRNKTVSEDRATAIVEFLVSGGVKRERLSGIGYGETKPIAENSTSAGKAQNRRIEFTMIAPGETVVAPAEASAEP